MSGHASQTPENDSDQTGKRVGRAKPAFEKASTQRALDELFTTARKYRGSKDFRELLHFTTRFRSYAPFNALLTHVQMPGALFVAPAHRWLSDYGRRVTSAARPLVILQPMGPVMFVFDVSDTEPLEHAPALPAQVTAPFEVSTGDASRVLELTIANAARDGVRVQARPEGSQSAGRVLPAQPDQSIMVTVAVRPKLVQVRVPRRFEVVLNELGSREQQYATLVHELAHLYCGHLGTPDERWWPDRRGLDPLVMEFEAESISYIVCQRLGVASPSAAYLAHYLSSNENVPEISLELVMKVAGLVEQMGRARLQMRKNQEKGRTDLSR